MSIFSFAAESCHFFLHSFCFHANSFTAPTILLFLFFPTIFSRASIRAYKLNRQLNYNSDKVVMKSYNGSICIQLSIMFEPWHKESACSYTTLHTRIVHNLIKQPAAAAAAGAVRVWTIPHWRKSKIRYIKEKGTKTKTKTKSKRTKCMLLLWEL